jgi:hypothetical protein
MIDTSGLRANTRGVWIILKYKAQEYGAYEKRSCGSPSATDAATNGGVKVTHTEACH